jgi:hypothetical protein
MAENTSRKTTWTARRIEAQQNATRALSLLCRGYTYQQVADEIGWANRSVAYNAVWRELRRQAAEPAKDFKELQIRRYEEDLAEAWDWYHKCPEEYKNGAMANIVRIQGRLDKLHGTEAPTRNEFTGAGGGPIQIQELTNDELNTRLDSLIAQEGARGIVAAARRKAAASNGPTN